MASTITQRAQKKLNMLQQDILMNAFKKDSDGALYNWMKEEYYTQGNPAIHSMIKKYKQVYQEEATDEELQYIDRLYNSYVIAYLPTKNKK